MNLEDLPPVERLRCEPGDVIVYTCPQRLRPEYVDAIRERFWAIFGRTVPIVVLDSGGRLQVVNKAELEP